MSWRDDGLKWNSSAYRGINEVYIAADRIWKPDVTLHEDVTEAFLNVEKRFRARVISDGQVRWVYPVVLRYFIGAQYPFSLE